MSILSRFRSLLADIRNLDRGNIRIILYPENTISQRSNQVFWVAITTIFVYIYVTYSWTIALLITSGIVVTVRIGVEIYSRF